VLSRSDNLVGQPNVSGCEQELGLTMDEIYHPIDAGSGERAAQG
jgi:hypothetical protein